MKYVAVIESENELTEDVINTLKSTTFVSCKDVSYCFDIVSVVKAPQPMEISFYGELGWKDSQTTKHIKEGYNQALSDCGVAE